MSGEQSDTIRSIERSIALLNCFSYEDKELSLTEISNRVGLAKSTTSRILNTLIQNGIISKNTNTYSLGHRLLVYGNIASETIDVFKIIRPQMEKLRDLSNETVSIYALEKNKRVCVHRVSSNQSIQHNVKVGEELSLNRGAGGKVLLAFQKDSFINSVIDMDNKSNRISMDSLLQIRKEKFGYSLDERGAGVNAMACPIFDSKKQVKYCLTISGPSERLDHKSIEKYKKNLIACSQDMSDTLNYIL